jgi:hypothetical protein
MTENMLERFFLLAILAGYCVVGALFAIRTPDWQTPDEPAHYNYIAQVAKNAEIPVIEMGDWDQNYLDALKASRFAPQLLDDLDTIQYEDHQPPLYYILAAPIYSLTNGSLVALRLFSVALGAIVVLSAHGVGKLMFPDAPWISVSASAFVAFLPQHIHILASVNNDSLAWAVIGVTLVACIAYVKSMPIIGGYQIQAWQLGVLVGIAFITKTTAYFMAGIVALTIVLGWIATYRETVAVQTDMTFPEERVEIIRPLYTRLVKMFAYFLIPALVLGGAWWIRDVNVYSFPDFLGLAAHNSVVVDQPRTADRIDLIGWGDYLKELSQTATHSFIGQFGWMGVPMRGWSYDLLRLGISLALLGLGVDLAFLHGDDDEEDSPEQTLAWIILLATILLSVLAFVYYNTEFQQYQGRYMFPMLIPLGVGLALGVDAWRRLITNVFAARLVGRDTLAMLLPWLTVLVFLPMSALDIWLLWKVIVPNLNRLT